MLATTTSLVVTAMQVNHNSRLRQVASEIASDQLDCAVASLNVTTFPTPCGAQDTLLNEQGYSGQAGVPAMAAVVAGGNTYQVEQEVQPGNGACTAPSGGAPPELQITDWVTWAPNATLNPNWWAAARFGPSDVEETSIVAVPASALNPSDGSLLAKITDDAVNGQNNATVNLYSGATLLASLVTGQSGCALFANIAPGTYRVTAFEANWIDSNNDLSAGTPAPLGGTGTGMTANVAAAGTVTLPASIPFYYAQAAYVLATYSAPSPYNTPMSGLLSLPLSFYNSSSTGLVTNPYIASAATTGLGDPVFPFHTSPSYTVVAGSCGTDSVPNGGYLADGVAVPTAGSIAPGSTTTIAISLTPVTIAVQNNSGVQQVGASLTAAASTPSGAADGLCSATFPMPSLVLGTTSAATAVGGATTTAVTSNAVPSISPSPVTFTATVAPTGSATGAPTGTVTFKDGVTTLGTSTLIGGVAIYTGYSLTIGSHTITATYSGDANFTTSTSSTFTQTVQNAGLVSGTTTTVTSSAPNSVATSPTTPVTFTAWVVPSGSTTAVPTGTVDFSGIAGCTGRPLSVAVGSGDSVATCTYTGALALGPHTITAKYNADANFSTSTSLNFTQTVVLLPAYGTTTSVTSSAPTAMSGSPVTLTATVAGGSPTRVPTGTVTFMDGAAPLGTASLSAATSVPGGVDTYTVMATYTTSSLASGSHPITAIYSGDSNFSASTSIGTTQVVLSSDLLSSLPDGYYLIGATASGGTTKSTNEATAVVAQVSALGVSWSICSGGTFSGGYYSGTNCTTQPAGPMIVKVQ